MSTLTPGSICWLSLIADPNEIWRCRLVFSWVERDEYITLEPGGENYRTTECSQKPARWSAFFVPDERITARPCRGRPRRVPGWTASRQRAGRAHCRGCCPRRRRAAGPRTGDGTSWRSSCSSRRGRTDCCAAPSAFSPNSSHFNARYVTTGRSDAASSHRRSPGDLAAFRTCWELRLGAGGLAASERFGFWRAGLRDRRDDHRASDAFARRHQHRLVAQEPIITVPCPGWACGGNVDRGAHLVRARAVDAREADHAEVP